jgi:hypothetical protein
MKLLKVMALYSLSNGLFSMECRTNGQNMVKLSDKNFTINKILIKPNRSNITEPLIIPKNEKEEKQNKENIDINNPINIDKPQDDFSSQLMMNISRWDSIFLPLNQ